MSLDLQKMVWEDPAVKGTPKFVLLCLASFVSHNAWRQGRELLAWPSQNTVARRCGIERSTVERALKKLAELGKIRDTGKRKTRRSVVYELYPSAAPVPDVKAGWEYTDLPDHAASHLPESRASEDVPDGEAGQADVVSHLPDPANDLPDPARHLPESAASTCPNLPHKRVRREEKQKRTAEMNAGAGARGAIDSESDPSEELEEVEKLLGARPADKLLTRRRDELRSSLAGEVAA